MKTVYVNRATWGTRRLLSNDTGKMCCLGFVCKSYGLKNNDILGIGYPDSLPEIFQLKLPNWMRAFADINAERAINVDVRAIGKINDSNMSWEKKEELLKPLFAKHGIRLVFRW